MGLLAACLGLLLGAAAADTSAAAAGLGWADVSVDAHSLLQEWTKHGAAARSGRKIARPHRHARTWDETNMLKQALFGGRRPHRNYEISGNDMTELFGNFKEYNQALIISNTFTHFDVNGDKKLDRKEIDTLLYYLGHPLPDYKINQIMANLDHVIPDQLVQLSEFFFWFTWPTIESEESLKTKIKSMRDEGASREHGRGLVATHDSVLDNNEIVALNTTDPETVFGMFGKFTQYSEVLRVMYFFKVFDLDWDLKMRQSEFVHLLKYLDMGSWSESDIGMLIEGLDVLKRDGEVELNEFLYWFTPAFTNIWEAAVADHETVSSLPEPEAEGPEPENESQQVNLSNASEQVTDLMNQLNDLAASVENRSNLSNVSNLSSASAHAPDLTTELKGLSADANDSLEKPPKGSGQALRQSLHQVRSSGSSRSTGAGGSSRGFSQYKQALLILNVFAHFDKDADDRLDWTEMLDVLHYLGEYWSEGQVYRLITDLDHVIADYAVQPSEFFWWFTSSDITRAEGLQREVESMKQVSLAGLQGRPSAVINDTDVVATDDTDLVLLDSDRIPANASDVLAVFGRFSEYRESLKILFFFHNFDLNKDGHIDAHEFSTLLEILEPGRWTYEETLALLYNLDAINQDGAVALNEFFQWFTPTFKHHMEAAIHEAALKQGLLRQSQGDPAASRKT